MPFRDEPWPTGTPCWVDLAVPDVAAAQEFYGAVLGWSFQTSGEEYGGYVMCQREGRDAAGIGRLQAEGQPVVWTTYLASDAVDETARAIGSAGGKVLVEPFDVPGVGRMCMATDEQGAAFGVYQAAGHPGVGVYGEPGSLAWNELYVPDPVGSQAFYRAVFGHRFDPLPEAPGAFTFSTPGRDEPAGSVAGLADHPAGTPPHWLAYFLVEDADAAAATARSRGGRLLGDAVDTPYGRIVVLTDPQGATVALLGASTSG